MVAMDLIIEDGRVVDGTGKLSFVADVGIIADRIADIGDLSGAQGRRISARGKVVAPGFIDIHTHSDFTLLVNPNAESAVRQGVTTLVVGNCGHSCAPAPDPQLITRNIIGYSPGFGLAISWNSFGEYLDKLEQSRPSTNVAALVGHGALRIATMGFANRPASPEELQRMADLLDRALDEGAVGFSTGLEYAPGNNATDEELAALCVVAARRNRLHATHMRNRTDKFVQATREVITSAQRSGCSLQLSHLAPRFWATAAEFAQVIDLIEEARSHLDVACDMYPYTWGMTTLAVSLPPWVYDGGKTQVLERLRDSEARRRFRQYAAYPQWHLVANGQWEKLVLFQSRANSHLIGKTFAEIAANRGTDIYDTMYDLLWEEGEDFYNVIWLSNTSSDEDLAKTFALPYCMFASDGVTLAHYGPLKAVKMQASSYGYAPRSIQVYVRERRQMALEEAVYRMTGLPASKLGLMERGFLRKGAKADIVVFTPELIADNTQPLNPNQYPSGIELVLVNGAVVFQHGNHTGLRPGTVLRSFA
jgi:N-acyl-D-amino-acid deacylase